MTEREALPYEDLGAWFTDDLRPGWARYWNEAPAAPAAPPEPPWFRNPRVLLTVITVAAAALVVAAVLLVTLSKADFNQTRQLRSINPAPTATATRPAETASAAPAPTAAPGQESEVTPAESPVPSADAPPQPAMPRSVDPSHSDGPRINVTRTPMSFTPGHVPAN
jgi:hypothetical protein